MQVLLSDSTTDPVVISVHGNLDVDSAGELIAALDQALDRPRPRVIIDLAAVDFCDSTGLSAFILGHNRAAEAGGWLRLAGPSDWLRRLLDTLGLSRQLAVHATVTEARSVS
jgi:anti-anti-sigma factor